ncbi:hypothetical protein ACFUIY_14670 [Streptomyces griseorubiginosus]|uniref:hypothetical protein n=1 Tax=Streptomyces griseorubiginosus TaxID=67304 RepID=UPI00363E2B8A
MHDLAQRDRPWSELRDSGLLWLINRVVFHPRGIALSVRYDERGAHGWSLVRTPAGEPWQFDAETDTLGQARAEATLAEVGALPTKTHAAGQSVVDTAACRLMETRTCPESYGSSCGERPCARFESDDPMPWQDAGGDLVAAQAALDRVRETCQGVRDRRGPGGMINATQILGLLSPTWPDGNCEAPAPSTTETGA